MRKMPESSSLGWQVGLYLPALPGERWALAGEGIPGSLPTQWPQPSEDDSGIFLIKFKSAV